MDRLARSILNLLYCPSEKDFASSMLPKCKWYAIRIAGPESNDNTSFRLSSDFCRYQIRMVYVSYRYQ